MKVRSLDRRSAAATILASAAIAALTGCSSSAPSAEHATLLAGAQTREPASIAAVTTATSNATAITPAPPSASRPPGKALLACAMVTEPEVGTALGREPVKGRAFRSHGSSQCQFGTYQTGFVLVNLTPVRGQAGYDLMHSNAKVGHPHDVAGIGDRAFEIDAPHTASIYFAKGDALVLVMIEIAQATAPPKAAALALAKSAAARA